MNLYNAIHIRPFISKALRYGPYVARESHSFICHPHTNHTCLYSPAARRHRLLAGTHCAYPRRDGQAELTWVAGYIHRYVPHRKSNLDTVTHPSTNRAPLSLSLHSLLRLERCCAHNATPFLTAICFPPGGVNTKVHWFDVVRYHL